MRRNSTVVVVGLLILLSGLIAVGPSVGVAQQDCSYPVTATDATGETVTIEEEPGRIVTLNPSAAQTLWEVGAREKVVGVSQFAGFLEGASNLTTVTKGFPSQVQVEKVISLNPDLVLAPNTIPNETVNRLRQANVIVFRFHEATSIEDIYNKTRRIGRLAGACQGASETVAWMKEQIGIVREAVRGKERPEVLYPMRGGFAPGPNSFIGGMIEAAGGHNIVAEANFTRNYPKLSGEFVVQQDPQWLIASYPPGNATDDPRSLIPAGKALRNTTAWEKGQIVVVNANNISQPAPRIVYPIRKMAKAFHPEAYAEAAATATPSPTPTPTATATATPSGTDTGGQPGFGASTALVALVALVVGLRRR